MLTSVFRPSITLSAPISSISDVAFPNAGNSCFGLQEILERAINVPELANENILATEIRGYYDAFLKRHNIDKSCRLQEAQRLFKLLQANGFVKTQLLFGEITLYLPHTLPTYSQPSLIHRLSNYLERFIIEKKKCKNFDEALLVLDRTYTEYLLQREFFHEINQKKSAKRLTKKTISPSTFSSDYNSLKLTNNTLVINKEDIKQIIITSSIMKAEGEEDLMLSKTLNIADNSEVLALAKLSDNLVATAQNDNNVYVWDTETNTRVMKLCGHDGPVTSLVVLPDGTLVSGGKDRKVIKWDIKNMGHSIGIFENANVGPITSLAILANGNVAIGGTNSTGQVCIWDAKADHCNIVLQAPTSPVLALTGFDNNTKLAAGTKNGKVCIWDSIKENYAGCSKIFSHGRGVFALAGLSSGKLASGSSNSTDSTVCIWEPHAESGSDCPQLLKAHKDTVMSLTELSDNRLASGGRDNMIYVCDLNTNKCTEPLQGHDDFVRSIIALNNNTIISGSEDKNVKKWDLKKASCTQTWRGRDDAILVVKELSPGLLYSGGIDNTVRLWDQETGSCIRTLQGHTGHVVALAKLSNNIIASGAEDGTIRIWDLTNGNLIRTINIGSNVYALATLATLVPEIPEILVSGGADNIIHVLNANTGELINNLYGPQDSIRSLAKFANGKIAAASNDHAVYTGDPLVVGDTLKKLLNHTDYARTVVALSETIIASGSYDTTICIWNATTSELLKCLKGCHSDSIRSIIPLLGERLASVGEDKTVCISDTITGKFTKIPIKTAIAYSLATLDDGGFALGGENANIEIWKPVSTPDANITFIISGLKGGKFILENEGKVNETNIFTQQQVKNSQVYLFLTENINYNVSVSINNGFKILPPERAKIVWNFDPSSESTYYIIIGVVGGSLGITLAVSLIICACINYKNRLRHNRNVFMSRRIRPDWIISPDQLTPSRREIYTDNVPEKVRLAKYMGADVIVKTLQGGLPIKVTDENRDDFVNLVRESILMSNLHFPNIVTLHGVVTEGDNYGLVMEYFPNGSLSNVFQRCQPPISWHERLQIALDIVNGVNYLHTYNPSPIIHDDLKSSNIFIFIGEGNIMRAKIGDFGSAGFQGKKLGQGTLYWMAPELLNALINKQKYIATLESDIFSVGMILWELAAWQIPYQQDHRHYIDITQDIANGLRPRVPDETPEWYAALIRRCWDAVPNKRPKINEVQRELIKHQKDYLPKSTISKLSVTTTTTPNVAPILPSQESLNSEPTIAGHELSSTQGEKTVTVPYQAPSTLVEETSNFLLTSASHSLLMPPPPPHRSSRRNQHSFNRETEMGCSSSMPAGITSSLPNRTTLSWNENALRQPLLNGRNP